MTPIPPSPFLNPESSSKEGKSPPVRPIPRLSMIEGGIQEARRTQQEPMPAGRFRLDVDAFMKAIKP